MLIIRCICSFTSGWGHNWGGGAYTIHTYISLKCYLRDFGTRSMRFRFGDHFLNSHNLFC